MFVSCFKALVFLCFFFFLSSVFCFLRLPYILVSFFLKTKRKPAEIKTDRYGRQLRCIPDKYFMGFILFLLFVL